MCERGDDGETARGEAFADGTDELGLGDVVVEPLAAAEETEDRKMILLQIVKVTG